MDGVPNANSTCDRTIKGDAYPFLPKLQGLLTTPGTSPLLKTVSGSLSCQYDLLSGEEQSVLLTVTGSTPSQSVMALAVTATLSTASRRWIIFSSYTGTLLGAAFVEILRYNNHTFTLILMMLHFK